MRIGMDQKKQKKKLKMIPKQQLGVYQQTKKEIGGNASLPEKILKEWLYLEKHIKLKWKDL